MSKFFGGNSAAAKMEGLSRSSSSFSIASTVLYDEEGFPALGLLPCTPQKPVAKLEKCPITDPKPARRKQNSLHGTGPEKVDDAPVRPARRPLRGLDSDVQLESLCVCFAADGRVEICARSATKKRVFVATLSKNDKGIRGIVDELKAFVDRTKPTKSQAKLFVRVAVESHGGRLGRLIRCVQRVWAR